MDAKQNLLDEKRADLLKQAADVAAQIQAQEQGSGTPHYDQIEIPAHEVGRRLSQIFNSPEPPMWRCSRPNESSVLTVARIATPSRLSGKSTRWTARSS